MGSEQSINVNSLEMKYEQLFNNISDAVIILGSDFEIITANKAALDLFDVSSGFEALFANKDDYTAILKQLKEIGIIKARRYSVKSKNAVINEVLFNAAVIDCSRKDKHYQLIINDVKPAQSEKKLLSHLNFLNVLIDTIPNPVFYKDSKAVYKGCNKIFADMIIGLPRKEIIGKTVYDFAEQIPRNKADIYHQQDLELINNAGIQVYETSVKCSDGAYRDFLFNKATFNDAKGKVAGLVGVMWDMSETRKSEKKYENLFKYAPIGIFQTTMEGELISANIAIANIFGYGTSEEFITAVKDARMLYANPDDRNSLISSIKKDDKLRYFETKFRHRDGSVINASLHLQLVRREDKSVKYIEGFLIDVSAKIIAEQSLEKSEKKFKSIFEQSNDAIVLTNSKGIIIEWNLGAEIVLGRQATEMKGKYIWDIQYEFTPDDEKNEGTFALIKKKITSLLENPRAIDFEELSDSIIQRPDGALRMVQTMTFPIVSEDSLMIGFIVRDITEHQLTENKLWESYQEQKELEKIIDKGPAIAILWRNETQWPIEYISENVRQLGYMPDNFYSGILTFDSIIYEEDKENVFDEIQQFSHENKNEFQLEYRIITKAGEIRHIDSRLWIRRNRHGAITHFQGVLIDVTERKQVEQELQKTNRMLRIISDCNEELIRSNSEEELYRKVCRILVEIGRYSMAWVGIAAPDDEKSIRPVASWGRNTDFLNDIKVSWGVNEFGKGIIAETIRSGEPGVIQNIRDDTHFNLLRDKSLQYGFASQISLPVKLDGHTIGSINIFSRSPYAFDADEMLFLKELSGDISYGVSYLRMLEEQEHYQNQLKLSEQKFRRVVHKLVDGLILIDENGFVVELNRAANDILGVDDEKVSGLHYVDFLLYLFPDFYNTNEKKIGLEDEIEYYLKNGKLLKSANKYERIYRHPTGKAKYILGTSFSIKTEKGYMIVSMIRDISERKKTIEALKESETRFRELFNNMSSGVAVLVPKGEGDDFIFKDFNKSAERIEKVKKEDLLGRSVSELFPSLRESDLMVSFREVWKTGEPKFNPTFYFKDEHISGWRESYVYKLPTGEIVSVFDDVSNRVHAEQEIKKLNLELENRVIERTAQLEKALNEITVEVSVRKKMTEELRKAKDETAKALEKEKDLVELKSRFISMISHEYRTPLTIILSSVNLLNRFIEKNMPDNSRKYIRKIKKSIKEMTSLLENVTFVEKSDADKIEVNYTETDMVRLCKELIDEVEIIYEKQCDIKFEQEGEFGKVNTDASLIRHILVNLLTNAVKYSGADPDVKLTLINNDKDFTIKVRDNGIGISEDDMQNLFESFQRGKNTGAISGTGLGLSIVKRFVKLLDGNISVKSELDRGSEFVVSFPKSENVN